MFSDPYPAQTGLRDGINQLVAWLTNHPNIPFAFVHYADNTMAELTFQAGRFDALTTAADIADALTDPLIEVTDPHDKRVAYLTISGTTSDDHLDIVAGGSVYDDARKALLAMLGTPAVPGTRLWRTTAGALRELVTARGER